MSLDFFPCKTPIPYDASYVYDACNVLMKSYSKSIVATTHGIVLVKSTTGLVHINLELYSCQDQLKTRIFCRQFCRLEQSASSVIQENIKVKKKKKILLFSRITDETDCSSLRNCWQKTWVFNWSWQLYNYRSYSISRLLGTVTTQWLDSDSEVTVDKLPAKPNYTVGQLCSQSRLTMLSTVVNSDNTVTVQSLCSHWWNMSFAVYVGLLCLFVFMSIADQDNNSLHALVLMIRGVWDNMIYLFF